MRTVLNWIGAICLALTYGICCLGAADDYTFKILVVLMTVAAISIGLPRLVDDIQNNKKGSEV